MVYKTQRKDFLKFLFLIIMVNIVAILVCILILYGEWSLVPKERWSVERILIRSLCFGITIFLIYGFILQFKNIGYPGEIEFFDDVIKVRIKNKVFNLNRQELFYVRVHDILNIYLIEICYDFNKIHKKRSIYLAGFPKNDVERIKTDCS